MNQRMSLCGPWEMKAVQDAQWISAQVPGSVYADLLDNRRMDDPYWRANELDAERLMEKDYLYRRTSLDEEALACDALLLVCEGLDTLAAVTVNGQDVLHADNMHRTWVKDVLSAVHAGENDIAVRFSSPIRFEWEAYARSRVDGSSDCTQGFPFFAQGALHVRLGLGSPPAGRGHLARYIARERAYGAAAQRPHPSGA